jgi:hypothetical protein
LSIHELIPPPLSSKPTSSEGLKHHRSPAAAIHSESEFTLMSLLARLNPRRLIVVLAVATAAILGGIAVSDHVSTSASASAADDTAGRTWSRVIAPLEDLSGEETTGRTWS